MTTFNPGPLGRRGRRDRPPESDLRGSGRFTIIHFYVLRSRACTIAMQVRATGNECSEHRPAPPPRTGYPWAIGVGRVPGTCSSGRPLGAVVVFRAPRDRCLREDCPPRRVVLRPIQYVLLHVCSYRNVLAHNGARISSPRNAARKRTTRRRGLRRFFFPFTCPFQNILERVLLAKHCDNNNNSKYILLTITRGRRTTCG